MSPGLIAGFDAGQTHTSCRLAEAGSGRPLASGEGPGVSHLAADGGPERFREALRASLAAARRQLAEKGASRGDQPPLLAAAVGASGIEQGTAVQRQGLALAAEALGLASGQLLVTGDERTALRGAFPDGPGIVVISGTGTIAVGRDRRGREHRCAGWGWLLDGAGSAMDIGRDGLALSLQMADGRQPATPLREVLWRALGLDPAAAEAPQRLKAMVVAADFGPAGFARLAPALDQLAAGGDGGAAAILQRNAEALAAMAAAVAAALALGDGDDPVAVCPMGGAIEHLGQFRARFASALAARLPAACLVIAPGDACSGALTLARHQLAAERG
jgi:phenylacetic acid degradation operon negative regulatory protein